MPKKLDDSADPVANGRKDALTPRQELVAIALAYGKSVAAVCREMKVGENTVWVWYRLPHFRARVAEIRDRFAEQLMSGLLDIAAGPALKALRERLARVDPETGETAATNEDIEQAARLFIALQANLKLKAEVDEVKQQLGGSSEAAS